MQQVTRANEQEDNDEVLQATKKNEDTLAVVEKKEEVDDDMPSEEEHEPVCKVNLKEWQKLHDKWLHAVMQSAMGDVMFSTIPDIENMECIYCNPPTPALMLQPLRMFIKCYDLRLTIEKCLFLQYFTKWYQKVQEVDNNAILYPWAALD